MDFHVAQLLKEPIGSTRVFHLDEVAERPEEAGWEWVRGPIKLTRTNRGMLVQGDLTAAYQDTCSRCVSEFTSPLQFGLEEEFYPTIDVITGGPVEEPEDIDGFPIDAVHQIDLRDAVRQGVLLAKSMAPLCRPDCAGLCPECGHDLNTGPCGCRVESVDPRWAALTGWMSDLSTRLDLSDLKEG
jgi:uncharacterized protein